ncbi:MAG: hypothetical protein AB8B63_05205 [Granulosicoccus sp.]
MNLANEVEVKTFISAMLVMALIALLLKRQNDLFAFRQPLMIAAGVCLAESFVAAVMITRIVNTECMHKSGEMNEFP